MTLAEGAVERPPEFLRRDARQEEGDAAALVELLLETHRVTGTVDQTGVQRRLVDLLNTSEAPMLTVLDALSRALPTRTSSRGAVRCYRSSVSRCS